MQTITTRNAYLALFANVDQALNFETWILSEGDDMPPEAIAVLNGEDATPAYWQFLADQVVAVDDLATCGPPVEIGEGWREASR